MTLLTDQSEGTTPTTPTTHRHKFRPQTFALALVLTLLVASVVYGFTQHSHAVSVTKQRDTAQHSLAGTRATLHTTTKRLHQSQEDYSASRADLSTAEDQLHTCADVSKATMELFNSTDSLLSALQNYPDGLSDLDSAGRNIDRVSRLVKNNGFSNIQDFLDACKGTGGTGV